MRTALANAQWLARNAKTKAGREAAARHADMLLALAADLAANEPTLRPACPACGNYLLPCTATATGAHPAIVRK